MAWEQKASRTELELVLGCVLNRLLMDSFLLSANVHLDSLYPGTALGNELGGPYCMWAFFQGSTYSCRVVYFSASKLLEGRVRLPSTTLRKCICDQQGCWGRMEEADGGSLLVLTHALCCCSSSSSSFFIFLFITFYLFCGCGGFNKIGPHRLFYLDTWFLVDNIFGKDEEVCPC